MPATFRWQYQAKAEPLVVAVPVPDFGWFQQASEPIFPRRQLRSEGTFVRGFDNTELTPDIDWLQPQPDVIRPRYQIREGEAYQPEPAVPFNWWHQYPEPLPQPVRPEGYSALVEFGILVPFDIDWLQQHPEPLPLPTRPEGYFARGYESNEIAPPFDWWGQQPEPLPKPTRQESYFSLVEFAIPAPFDIDWLIQATDIFRRRHIVREGGAILGEPPIIPDSDWLQPQPDVIWPLYQVKPGFYSFVEPQPVIDIDWLVAQPDIIRPQYQVREGVAFGEPPITPTFDWFHQQADVTHRPHQVEPGWFAFVEISVPIPPEVINLDWFVPETPIFYEPHRVREGGAVLCQPPITEERIVATTAIILGGRLFQFQIKAEPLEPIIPVPDFVPQQQGDIVQPLRQTPGYFAFVEFAIPVPFDIDWLVQYPGPLPAPRRPEGLFARGYDDSEIAPDFDWWEQGPEPLPAPTRPEGYFSFIEFGIPVVLDIDWIRQHPEPLPRPIGPEGIYVRGFDDSELTPSFGWFQQYPEPLARPKRPEGFYALVEFGIPVVFDIDWLRQHPEPLPRPKRPEGFFVRGYSPTEITPNFGWFHQQPEPLPRPRRPEGYFALVEFGIPVIFDFDWFVQQADVFRRRHSVREGGMVLGQPPIVPFDWRPAQPDVIQPRHLEPGFYVRPEPVVPILDFGWWRQQPEPLSKPKRPFSEPTLILVPPSVFPDAWFQQRPEIIFRAKFRPYYYPQESRPDPLRDIFPGEWFQQYPEQVPGHKPRPLTNVTFTFTGLVGPLPEVVFRLLACLEPWEFFQNSLLPLPSGYLADLAVMVSSGYIAPGETPSIPSGYIKGTGTAPWDLTR